MSEEMVSIGEYKYRIFESEGTKVQIESNGNWVCIRLKPDEKITPACIVGGRLCFIITAGEVKKSVNFDSNLKAQWVC